MTAGEATERERMIAGRTYRSTDPELTEARAATKRVLHEYNNTHPDDEERRMELLRGLLGKVGQAWIEPPFRCDYGAQISMGEFVFANYDLTILDCAPVTIGNMVLFGPRVTLATASHPVDFRQRTVDMFEYAAPITIEEGAIGGFGAHLLTLASDEGLIDGGLKIRTMRLPDVFQDHDKPEKQYADAGLDADGIVTTVLTTLRHNSAGMIEGARA